MSAVGKPETITHAYRMPGGWEPVAKQGLTIENALALRAQGYTMLRAKRPFRAPFDHSMVQYLQSAGHSD